MWSVSLMTLLSLLVIHVLKTHSQRTTCAKFGAFVRSVTIISLIRLTMMFLGKANERDTKHLFCVRAAQTGKHLLRIQNVSDKTQKQLNEEQNAAHAPYYNQDKESEHKVRLYGAMEKRDKCEHCS